MRLGSLFHAHLFWCSAASALQERQYRLFALSWRSIDLAWGFALLKSRFACACDCWCEPCTALTMLVKLPWSTTTIVPSLVVHRVPCHMGCILAHALWRGVSALPTICNKCSGTLDRYIMQSSPSKISSTPPLTHT